MKIKSKGAAPRLPFTEAEMKEEALQKPISQVKKAEAARVKARKRLHQNVDIAGASPAADKAAYQKRTSRLRSAEIVKGLRTEPAAKNSVL